MTAAGKINASALQVNDRIMVKVSETGTTFSRTKTGEGVQVARVIEKTFRGAQGPYEARGKYIVTTTAGEFEAATIQTMWLAPEDNAGIKRAHAEALIEDAARPAAEPTTETVPASEEAGAAPAAPVTTEALEIDPAQELTLNSQGCKVSPISSEDNPEEIEMAENLSYAEARNYKLSTGETADLIALVSSVKPSDWVQATEVQPVGTVVYAYAMGSLRRGVVVKNTPTKTLVALTTAAASAPGGTSVRVQTATELHTTVYVAPAPVAEPEPVEFTEAEREELAEDFKTSGALDDAHAEALAEDLTLNSQDGKVVDMNNDASATQTRETTGSAVVRLMERVHARIRQNHPEVPEVVIVTGAGTGPLGGKWGHFRPRGWMAQAAEEGGAATHIHEMFMAGETLAKGARQVLQTMLHESAHALAQTREVQDTSRQGRWHNKAFLTTAQEMGLEYRKDKANPQIGYSEVTLTDATVDEYKDLLDALEAEIHLMVRLPGWLGGTGDEDDNGESNGGEGMGKAPKGPAQPNTNNIKCVCRCEEPNIIRMSRKVLDQAVVNCGDCDSLFSAA